MEISFLPITIKDVDRLKHFALNTFIQSYRHLNSEANFTWYVQRAFSTEKLLSELQSKESFFYFILSENNIIGYLKLNINESQTEKSSKDYLEIERIYLESDFKGLGIGRMMIQFAIEKARALSKPKIWLGVWDQNLGALLFYKKQGLKETGSHIFRFGDEDQIDIIMEKNITDISDK